MNLSPDDTGIHTAHAATDAILVHVETAQRRLRRFGGAVVTEHGIFALPSARRSDLEAARLALDTALTIHQRTSWPSASAAQAELQQ